MDSPCPSAEAKNDELYPLDDAAIEFLAPRRQQVKALNTEINAVLTYFLMQHKLEGSWMLAENDRELVKRAVIKEAV